MDADNDGNCDDCNAIDISKAQVSIVEDCVYNGNRQLPCVEVVYDGTVLVPSTDFRFADDEGEIDAGEYEATIIGQGDFYGSVSFDWTIKKGTLDYSWCLGEITRTCPGFFEGYYENLLRNNGFRFSEGQDKELVLGTNRIYVDFVPQDTDNYEIIKNIPLTVELVEHNWVEEYVKTATCTEDGGTSYMCNICYFARFVTDEGSALGGEHQYEFFEVRPATCMENSFDVYKCKRCGDLDYRLNGDYASPDKHVFELEETGCSPTCVSDGWGTYICNQCGTREERDLPATGVHNYVFYNIVTASTCVTEGVEEYICLDCGKLENEVIPIDENAHKLNIDYEKTIYPTCENDGVAYIYCEVEGCDFSEEIIQEHREHIFEYDQDASDAATTETKLVDIFSCKLCGKIEKTEYVRNYCGHDVEFTDIQYIEQSCTQRGYTHAFCLECNAWIDYDFCGYAEHSLTYLSSIEPTELFGGYDVYECDICHNRFWRENDKKSTMGHHWDHWTIEPTCTNEGYTLYVCSDEGCGESYRTDFVASLGQEHEWVYSHSYDPDEITCISHSYDVYICSLCNAGEDRDNGNGNDPTNHMWDSMEETHRCFRYGCSLNEEQPHTYVDGVCVCGKTQDNPIDFSGYEVVLSYPEGTVFSENGNPMQTGLAIVPSVSLMKNGELLRPDVRELVDYGEYWGYEVTELNDYYVNYDCGECIETPGTYSVSILIHELEAIMSVEYIIESNPNMHTLTMKHVGAEDDHAFKDLAITREGATGFDVSVSTYTISKHFLGWFETDSEGNLLSSKPLSRNLSYTHTMPDHDVYLIAKFVPNPTIMVECQGNFTFNGFNKVDEFDISVDYGSMVEIACQDDRFEYWTNDAGEILTTDKSFSFKAVDSQKFKAVLKAGGEGRVEIDFLSDLNVGVLWCVAEKGQTIEIPAVPNKYGYEKVGWDYNGDGVFDEKDSFQEIVEYCIDNNIEKLVVKPIYTKNQGSFTITVYDFDGNQKSTTIAANEEYRVYASDAPDGYIFSHWTDGDGRTLCCNRDYRFYVMKDVSLIPVYVEEDTEIIQMPLAYFETIVVDSEKSIISFVSMGNVPERYSMVKSGVLLTNDETIGNNSEEFTIENGSIINRYKTWSGTACRYTLNKINVSEGDTWYARSCVVYKDDEDGVYVIYGEIASATME